MWKLINGGGRGGEGGGFLIRPEGVEEKPKQNAESSISGIIYRTAGTNCYWNSCFRKAEDMFKFLILLCTYFLEDY